MKVIIVGAGINGLVAANYLQRHGCDVTLLERKIKVGGAATSKSIVYRGEKYTYPTGASVLGMMQDFVFEDTGLSKLISLYLSSQAEIVYFSHKEHPCRIFDSIEQLKLELKDKWGEQGKVELFFDDLDKVVGFLRAGYKVASVPNVALAQQVLGDDMVNLWITGSARHLLNHYFTAEETKVFFSISATESGPVLLDTPYSAFSIPLMVSGSVFDGKWGYVRGGIWQITEKLAELNQKIGVKIITSAKVLRVSAEEMTIMYVQAKKKIRLRADKIIFATDPVSAAKLLADQNLLNHISQKELLGSSGKLIMLFKNPVQWLDSTGKLDEDTALRYIIATPSLQAMDQSSTKIRVGNDDFLPSYFEIYCEGAMERKMGSTKGYDLLSVFFKDMAFGKSGKELKKVREAVTKLILEKIANKSDLIKSILLTPKDLSELFYFPRGNIDHIELTEGQTFFDRHYSPSPNKSFYQFGDNQHIYYCGAGAYPCGSVAGTAGYMCAKQILDQS